MLVFLLQSDDLELWFQAMREHGDDGEEVEEDTEEDVDTSKLNVSSNHTHVMHARTHTLTACDSILCAVHAPSS